jgi:hypothetical protein
MSGEYSMVMNVKYDSDDHCWTYAERIVATFRDMTNHHVPHDIHRTTCTLRDLPRFTQLAVAKIRTHFFSECLLRWNYITAFFFGALSIVCFF